MRWIVSLLLLQLCLARGLAAQTMVDVPRVKGLSSVAAKTEVEKVDLVFEVRRPDASTRRYTKGESLDSEDKGKIVSLQDPDPDYDPGVQLASPGGVVQVVLQIPPEPDTLLRILVSLTLLIAALIAWMLSKGITAPKPPKPAQ